ncbi:hypothetical protein NCK_05275 [Citrobacter koseri]|uniref:hypothetical protein n=1 Tax=Citrobacter koseri TaxID=545 RepID=UPI001C626206|nr:hypothetical protein [Citrobacter koseri]QYG82694.1 hypothetical protein NCK_05275 [Citrobacter koseri]
MEEMHFVYINANARIGAHSIQQTDNQQRSPCQLEKNAHDFLFHSVMLLLSTRPFPARGGCPAPD